MNAHVTHRNTAKVETLEYKPFLQVQKWCNAICDWKSDKQIHNADDLVQAKDLIIKYRDGLMPQNYRIGFRASKRAMFSRFYY